MINPDSVVAVIPAAGHATRLGLRSGSKEMLLLPVISEAGTDPVMKPVCQVLIEKLAACGIHRILLVIRREKTDIPAYFKDGSKFGVHIDYINALYPYGPPFSIDSAYSQTRSATVVTGFPDILFKGDDAFTRLLESMTQRSCAAMIGLFPANRPEKVDMVDVDESGTIRDIVIKPGKSSLTRTWGIAAWSPEFSEFMHSHLQHRIRCAKTESAAHLGQIFQAAIQQGLKIGGLEIAHEPFLDIGTADDLARARGGTEA